MGEKQYGRITAEIPYVEVCPQGFVPREQGSLRSDSHPYPRPPSLGYPREISPTQEQVGRVSPVASSRQTSSFMAGRLFPQPKKRPLCRNQYDCPHNVGIPYPQGRLGIPTLDPQSLSIFPQGGGVGQVQTPRNSGVFEQHNFGGCKQILQFSVTAYEITKVVGRRDWQVFP